MYWYTYCCIGINLFWYLLAIVIIYCVYLLVLFVYIYLYVLVSDLVYFSPLSVKPWLSDGLYQSYWLPYQPVECSNHGNCIESDN